MCGRDSQVSPIKSYTCSKWAVAICVATASRGICVSLKLDYLSNHKTFLSDSKDVS